MLPAHTDVLPVIFVGAGGVVTGITSIVAGALLPQAFMALTAMLPGLLFVNTPILEDALVPVQPVGNVHAYEVAPLTLLML